MANRLCRKRIFEAWRCAEHEKASFTLELARLMKRSGEEKSRTLLRDGLVRQATLEGT